MLAPTKLYSNKPRSESSNDDEPDVKELDLLHQSFKPGLKVEQRYRMQDSASFYRTQFPGSAYETRLSSFATRISSADPGQRHEADSLMKSTRKSNMQATCRDMKLEVTKAKSMHNYNIKTKHMGTM